MNDRVDDKLSTAMFLKNASKIQSNHLPVVRALAVTCCLSLSCLSPVTLNRAVMTYDESVTNTLSQQLLLNIARAQHHQPLHFTGVSNIAATFDFRFGAGVSPPFTGETGLTLLPIFGGSVAESPTISIVPIEGEEFTKRLLTPLQENTLTLLLRQRVDIDLLLRLMAQEVRIKENNRERSFRNSPEDKEGYEMFRRVALHLSAIQDQNELYAEPLVFDRTWTLPAASVTSEGFQALEDEYLISFNPGENTYTLRKKVTGRILITNYDPDTLSDEESARLNDEAEDWPPNDISFDIRPGHMGGEYPLRGDFRLRSIRSILDFLGDSIGEKPEFHVERDPRSPPILDNINPVNTMELIVADSVAEGSDRFVFSNGMYYSVKNDGPYGKWNRQAFQLLYLLFQMTISEIPRTGVPGITIAK